MEINGPGSPPIIDLQQTMETGSLYPEEANTKRKEAFHREIPTFADQLDHRNVEGVHSKAEANAVSATQNTGNTGMPNFRTMDNFLKSSAAKAKIAPRISPASYKEEYSGELSSDSSRIDVRI